MIAPSRLLPALLACVALGLGACGGDDEEEPAAGTQPATVATQGETAGEAAPQPAGRAPLSTGGVFAANDLADCLLDAGVGAAVSLDGASIELHDASSQIIVEQGNAEVLVYDSAKAAQAREAGYRESSGELSEVTQARNVLVQTDPEVSEQVKAQIRGCTGA